MPRRSALLLVAVLAIAPAWLRGEEPAPAAGGLRKALEMSLLFPGLGQLREKQYLKAAIFAAAEVTCLVLVIANAGKGDDAYWNYRAAATIDDAVAWRAETERFDRRRNTAILAAAGVWVLNMVDIFVYAKKKYGRARSLAFHPYYRHESHAVGAGFTCRF